MCCWSDKTTASPHTFIECVEFIVSQSFLLENTNNCIVNAVIKQKECIILYICNLNACSFNALHLTVYKCSGVVTLAVMQTAERRTQAQLFIKTGSADEGHLFHVAFGPDPRSSRDVFSFLPSWLRFGELTNLNRYRVLMVMWKRERETAQSVPSGVWQSQE